MELNTFRTVTEAEESGVWIDIGEGARILIGRLGSKRHTEAYRKATSPPHIKAAIERGDLPVEESIRIQVETLAGSILFGWEGFTDNGQPVPYTPDIAKQFLAESKDFRAKIHTLASDQANFRAEAVNASLALLKKS